MTNVLQQQFLYCFIWCSNQLLNLNIFSFCSNVFTYQLDFFVLTIEMICHSLTNWPVNLFINFWLFLVLFWMLWMHKSCCVPHVSQVKNSGTMFTKRLYSVSKEWVRSWSQAFLITYDKTLTKKLLAFHPEKVMRRKKRKK